MMAVNRCEKCVRAVVPKVCIMNQFQVCCEAPKAAIWENGMLERGRAVW